MKFVLFRPALLLSAHSPGIVCDITKPRLMFGSSAHEFERCDGVKNSNTGGNKRC